MAKGHKNSRLNNAGLPAAKKVRIDKWLWAARFFKTRSVASEAIKGGKISQQGARVKPSKEVMLGDVLTIRQGYFEKTVEVMELSDKRGPAVQAQTLYAENQESIERREKMKIMRQAQPAFRHAGEGRPTKRERRKIIKFTEK